MKIKKYIEIARITFINNIVYFWSFLTGNLFFVFIMFVYLMLWVNIYADKSSAIAGFDLQHMVWYLVVTEIITLSRPNVHTQISTDVKQGNIAYLLNKPYHYIGYNFSLFIGNFSIKVLANTLTGLVIGWAFVGLLTDLNPWTLPLVVLAILTGCLLNFFIFMCLALTAFWFEDNQAFFWIYSKLVFTLGGMLMPIDLFPLWLQDLARYLPFAYVTYVPAKLAVQFDMATFLSEFPIQLGYLGVFVALSFALYSRGTSALNVNGG